MKIPQQFVHLNQGPTLLVVAGTQEADFYLAESGTIRKVVSFKVEREHYSDREDYARRGSFVFESGSKFERDRENRQRTFLKEFKEKLREAVSGKKLETVYLFVPDQVAPALEKTLPTPLRKKIRAVYKGNFHRTPMLKLLEKTNTLP